MGSCIFTKTVASLTNKKSSLQKDGYRHNYVLHVDSTLPSRSLKSDTRFPDFTHEEFLEIKERKEINMHGRMCLLETLTDFMHWMIFLSLWGIKWTLFIPKWHAFFYLKHVIVSFIRKYGAIRGLATGDEMFYALAVN